MPASTWRRTASSTPAAIVSSNTAGSAGSPRSTANSTSVTAAERGSEPTWVVRIPVIVLLAAFSVVHQRGGQVVDNKLGAVGEETPGPAQRR